MPRNKGVSADQLPPGVNLFLKVDGGHKRRAVSERVLVYGGMLLVAIGFMQVWWGVNFFNAALPMRSIETMLGMVQAVVGSAIAVGGIYMLVRHWSGE